VTRAATACILGSPKYEVGSQPPEGYTQWFDWAEVQHKGGLRQKRCIECGKYRYPQEQCRTGKCSAREAKR